MVSGYQATIFKDDSLSAKVPYLLKCGFQFVFQVIAVLLQKDITALDFGAVHDDEFSVSAADSALCEAGRRVS